MSSVTNLMRCSPVYSNITLLKSEIIFRNGKQVNPLRKPNSKEKLIFFNVIWSNDTNLIPAFHIGFPSNRFGEFCYRIHPQNPNEEDFEYAYIISSIAKDFLITNFPHYKSAEDYLYLKDIMDLDILLVTSNEVNDSIKELLKTTKI
jgi:hypothetical protein